MRATVVTRVNGAPLTELSTWKPVSLVERSSQPSLTTVFDACSTAVKKFGAVIVGTLTVTLPAQALLAEAPPAPIARTR